MIYLFYPFDDGTALDTLDALQPGVGGTPGVVASPKIGGIYRSDGSYPAGLWSVTVNDAIFVVGHAAEGMKVLADAQKNMIDQTEVVDRMIACGLPHNVNCKIVMYACESGKGGPASLGSKVASSLKTKKYACRDNVWGFMFKVSTKANRDNALCVEMGKGNWVDYTTQTHALMQTPPAH